MRLAAVVAAVPLAVVPLSACAGTGGAGAGGAKAGGPTERPAWVSGEALEWPHHRYLVGVGVADDRASAEERARAEVARVFTTRVESVTTSHAAETSRTGDGRDSTVQERSVVDDTRSTTEKLLVGVQLAETWQDPATRQVYALAVLDRRQAAQRLRSDLASLDVEAQRHAAALSSDDRVLAATSAIEWRRVQRRRQPILADLRIVVPDDKPPAVDAALEARVAKALDRLVVILRVEGDREHAVEAGVVKGLAVLGFRPRAGGGPEPGDVTVTVTVTVEDLGPRDGWFYARAAGAVSAAVATDGRRLAEVRVTERGAATLEPEAAPRALKRLGDALAAKLPEAWAPAE